MSQISKHETCFERSVMSSQTQSRGTPGKSFIFPTHAGPSPVTSAAYTVSAGVTKVRLAATIGSCFVKFAPQPELADGSVFATQTDSMLICAGADGEVFDVSPGWSLSAVAVQQADGSFPPGLLCVTELTG